MSIESKKGYLKILAIILIFFIVLFFRSRVCERVIVNGQSMEPNFKDSDICWADKRYESIERYDVVVARTDNEMIIKRVIALPGDTIKIKDGTVYINDEKIDDEFDFETYPDGTKDYKNYAEDKNQEVIFVCEDNQYFLMGDNRQHSADSRITGPIDLSDIDGKIVMRFYPFNRIKKF